MKAISYSLFGYNRQKDKTSYEFTTYVRGFYTCVRVNRVLFPNWEIILNIDDSSYNSPYTAVFDWLQKKGYIKISLFHDNLPLCMAMLQRLKPFFAMQEGNWKYSHVICRDSDSVPTYRERQMVDEWIKEDKTIHCITDSISHNIPMMGGMIGVVPGYFNSRMKVKTFDELLAFGNGIDYSRKGSDQDFLNRVVYPRNHDSATEHFILGMKQTIPEGNGRHYKVPETILEDVPVTQVVTNDLAGHVGASGAYESVMIKWLNEYDPYEKDYADIERKFPQLFFWRQ